MDDPSLVCVGCGARYRPAERFCPRCRLPLTLPEPPDAEARVSDARRRARKIKPQLTEGELVRIAGARNQAEAEFIQALLLDAGVPSILRRTAGFDVPDFLAAGPRDVLVPASGADTAREVLLQTEAVTAPSTAPVVSPIRLLVALTAALALGAVVVWLLARLAA